MLDKNEGYIKNWYNMASWAQDEDDYYDYSGVESVFRSFQSKLRSWMKYGRYSSASTIGFRPFLEVLNVDQLGPDGLKAVTLKLNGGSIDGSSKDIQIVVKNGADFTAPASEGLTAPPCMAGRIYAWKGSDGKEYAPGDSVPSGVTSLTAQWECVEKFDITVGETYWFDLSGEDIESSGTVSSSVPDTSLHYVPFTYAGSLSAYVLNSNSDGISTASEEAAGTTKKSGQYGYYYPHSLFVSDYNIAHTANWNTLKDSGLIFGKNYTAGNLDYSMRTPSAGSYSTGAGAPETNEWDAILKKNSGYIKNWKYMYSWGQDTSKNYTSENRASRGYSYADYWCVNLKDVQREDLGFRPVLEILNTATMDSDALKAVSLDLNGGSLGDSTDSIKIIVKNGEDFIAPSDKGLKRPGGNEDDYFEWLGDDGVLYAPGDTVSADVTSLTAEWTPAEQFDLTAGGTYWFDLSGAGIPGTVNTGNSKGAASVPDATLHYVPFTYAGTVSAYNLSSTMATTEEYAQANRYCHSLFIADYAVKHTTGWDDLYSAGFIFGKDYTSDGVDYSMHAPSGGSWYSQPNSESQRGTPRCNEWDKILDKGIDYIKNWKGMYSWGQDTPDSEGHETYRGLRGYENVNYYDYYFSSRRYDHFGFRPVLEVLNPGALGYEGINVVTLNLNGGKIGENSDNIQIVVKSGEDFTAPYAEGLTRPSDIPGDYFKWVDSDGNTYDPGSDVPADVTSLTALWADRYTVTLHTNNGTIADGKNVTEYIFGEGAALPTSNDITREGFNFEGWYAENDFSGSPVTVIGRTDTGNKHLYAKWKDDDFPTGAIKVDTSEWYSFFGDITFDLFFNSTQEVSITASDTSGIDVEIGYLLSDRELDEEELENAAFTPYTGQFTLTPGSKYVIYAKLTDAGGNVMYINSDGIVVDSISPVISGIEEGKTYCEAPTVTVTDENIERVTKNGAEVTLDDNNQFTLTAAEGKQKIVATDLAGNKAEVIVTVNSGHTAAEDDGNCTTPVYCIYHPDTIVTEAKSHDFTGVWQNNDTYHWHTCQNNGCTVSDTKEEHSGSDDGDCTTAVTCKCGYIIKAAAPYHCISEWRSNGNGKHTRSCTNGGCDASEDGTCTGGKATCTKLAICDFCKSEYGDYDHSNHNLEKNPEKEATVTEAGHREYWHCTDCDKFFSNQDGTGEIADPEIWKAGEGKIDKLPPEIIKGFGQSITVGDKKELSFTSNAVFDDFIRVEINGSTLDPNNYTAMEGSTVVTLKAGYTASLPVGEHTIGIVSESGTAATTFIVMARAESVTNDLDSSSTGDNSQIVLWMVILLVSVAAVIAIIVILMKKKKRKKRK